MNTKLQKTLKYLSPLPKTSKLDLIVGKSRDKSVLDLGCVDHDHVYAVEDPEWMHGVIRSVAAKVVGVDILAEEVQILRAMGYDSIIPGDALTIRLEESFDVIIIGDLIEHVTNPEALLSTATYHLRPGGEVIITTPNPFFINQTLSILMAGQICVNPEHTVWFDKRTMYNLLERCGLTVTEFYWLENSWNLRHLLSWSGGTGIRKLFSYFVVGILLIPTLVLPRFRLWGYFSSDFAVVARPSGDTGQ